MRGGGGGAGERGEEDRGQTYWSCSTMGRYSFLSLLLPARQSWLVSTCSEAGSASFHRWSSVAMAAWNMCPSADNSGRSL